MERSIALTPDTASRLTGSRLSEQARSVWAKSWPNPAPDGVIEAWLPLHQHLADAAAVAGRLWDHWLAPAVVRMISTSVGSERAARALIVWLAGVHDLGKASPAFAVQVPTLAFDMEELGLRMDASLAGSDERRMARHELVSHLAVSDWLVASRQFEPPQARKIGSILAAHHGRPASRTEARQVSAQSRLLGDATWQVVRKELLEAAAADFTTEDDLVAWRTADMPQRVLVLLSAVVIVADWIASDDSLFPLAPLGDSVTASSAERAAAAWARLDMPSPWSAAPPSTDVDLFRERFDLPEPRKVQAELMNLARECQQPGLFILEAEMGIGKTEAALAAAEILAARFALGGVFIGLPTQATADGMFARVVEWASRLGLDDPINVFLGHGKSSQNASYSRMTRDARFRSIGDGYGRATVRTSSKGTGGDLVVAHHWFSSPKRGPLSNLTVGTIDQALMGALRSKHLMLRHLALAGKVVILDEVHAYDAFMGEYLERLLRWLGAYRVPVIMLSATLPADRRRAFAAAYSGTTDAVPPHPDEGGPSIRQRRRMVASDEPSAPPSDALAALDGDIGYPSIVVASADAPPRIVLPESPSTPRAITVVRADDNLDTLARTLKAALDDGGTAVIIRNTVTRVQETADYLRAHLDIPVIVAHSRFLARDRAEKDRELLRLFGNMKDSTRPPKMVVVASQVVEQSLDIDFDLMVSDLAPIDLLLQRAGRLHRHTRPHRPDHLRTPRLILTGVDWSVSPPQPVRGSQLVYARYILLRTLAALDGREMITLPDDIPAMVQRVYGRDPIGPAEWTDAIDSAHSDFLAEQAGKRARADVFRLPLESSEPGASLLGWVNGSAGDPATDSFAQASVRDGDETLEVLVVQGDVDGHTVRTPKWLSEGADIQIPDNEPPGSALTRTILGCALRLPAAMCVGGKIDVLISELEELYPVVAWHGSHALRGELVLKLDAGGDAHLAGFDLHYDPNDGLRYQRSDRRPRTEGEHHS